MSPPAPELSAEALALLDEAPCGLVQTSEDGTFIRANRTFCTWVGHTAAALVGKKRLQDLLTMGGRIFHQTHWAPLLQMQGSISEVKLDVRVADGGTLPMMFNAIRHTRDGVVLHDLAAYVARDRDKYEKELVQSRNRLQELVAETERLRKDAQDRAAFAEQTVGIVSHDLRNPISVIHMGAALLSQEDLPPEQRKVVDRISRANVRATRLISDLLDFTQAGLGGGLQVTREPIDLHQTIAVTIDGLALAYPDREIRHVRLGTGRCFADANRLEQMVGNLVSNAMVYGDRAKPVTITSSIEDETFSIAVHNEGPAIPATERANIFQPMVRGAATAGSRRSVGLGLYIVSEIAKTHGGTADVTSGDEGTTFRVVLPRD